MKYNPKLRRSTRNTTAYHNQTFLSSREARAIRIQCELIEPAVRLKRLGVNHMISFFGSARLGAGGACHQDYDAAYNIAYRLGKWSSSCVNDIGISSGGGPGIMEAVNRGAIEAGAKSIGMGIDLPFEQRNNLYISEDLDFDFHYFFTRKYWCVYLSKAFIIMPGGVGTLDEFFEILTLIQTDKIKYSIPIVLYNKKFWDSLINFDALVDYGTVSKEDLDLFTYCDTVEDTCDYIINNINLDPRTPLVTP